MQMVSWLSAQMHPTSFWKFNTNIDRGLYGAIFGTWYSAFHKLKKIRENDSWFFYSHLLVMCFIKCKKLKYKLVYVIQYSVSALTSTICF